MLAAFVNQSADPDRRLQTVGFLPHVEDPDSLKKEHQWIDCWD